MAKMYCVIFLVISTLFVITNAQLQASCRHNGRDFRPGQETVRNCQRCYCLQSGQWICKGESCTKGLQLIPSHDITVRNGSSVYIVCKHEKPKTKFFWFVNDRLHTTPQRRSRDGDSSVIRFDSKKFTSSIVSVVCGVTFSKMKRIKVFITNEEALPRGFPEIHAKHRTVEVSSGMEVSLSCPATGHPDPEISWFKFGLPVDISDNRFKLTPDSTLLISRSVPADGGLYQCMATNKLGSVLSDSTTELVVNKGVTFQVKGEFSFDESNTKIPPGSCLFIYLVTKNKTHQYKSDAVTKLPPSTSPGSLYKFIAYFQRRPEPGAYDLMAVLNFGSCRQNQELKDSIRDGDAVSLDNLGPNFIKSVDNELSNVRLIMQTIYNHLRDITFLGSVSTGAAFGKREKIPQGSCLKIGIATEDCSTAETCSNSSITTVNMDGYEFGDSVRFEMKTKDFRTGRYVSAALLQIGKCDPGLTAFQLVHGKCRLVNKKIFLVDYDSSKVVVDMKANFAEKMQTLSGNITFRPAVSEIPANSCLTISVSRDIRCHGLGSCGLIQETKITDLKLVNSVLQYEATFEKPLDTGLYLIDAYVNLGWCSKDQNVKSHLKIGDYESTVRNTVFLLDKNSDLKRDLVVDLYKGPVSGKAVNISGSITLVPQIFPGIPASSCLIIQVQELQQCMTGSSCIAPYFAEKTIFDPVMSIDSKIHYKLTLSNLNGQNFSITAILNIGWCKYSVKGTKQTRSGDYHTFGLNSFTVNAKQTTVVKDFSLHQFFGTTKDKNLNTISVQFSLQQSSLSEIPKGSCISIQDVDKNIQGPFYVKNLTLSGDLSIPVKLALLSNQETRRHNFKAILNNGWCSDGNSIQGRQIKDGDFSAEFQYIEQNQLVRLEKYVDKSSSAFEGPGQETALFRLTLSSKDDAMINVPAGSCIDVLITDSSFLDLEAVVISSQYFKYAQATSLNRLDLRIPKVGADSFEFTTHVTFHMGHCLQEKLIGDLTGEIFVDVAEGKHVYDAPIFLKEYVSASTNLCTYVSCRFHGKCTMVDNSPECSCPNCPLLYDPVCASDQRTYDSECEMKRTSCRTRKELSLIYRGKCEDFTVLNGIMEPSGKEMPLNAKCHLFQFNSSSRNWLNDARSLLNRTANRISTLSSEYAILIPKGNSENRAVMLANAGRCPKGFVQIPKENVNDYVLKGNITEQSKFTIYSFKGCGSCSFDSVCDYRREANGFVCACIVDCGDDDNPVCGSDGVTYQNECKMKSRNCFERRSVEVMYPGKCEPSTCRHTKCLYGKCKRFDNGTEICQCEMKCSKMSPSWVCGSNGKNYFNDCERKRDICLSQKNIPIVSTRRCGTSNNFLSGTIFQSGLAKEKRKSNKNIGCLIIQKTDDAKALASPSSGHSSLLNSLSDLLLKMDYSFILRKNLASRAESLPNSGLGLLNMDTMVGKISNLSDEFEKRQTPEDLIMGLMQKLKGGAKLLENDSKVFLGECSGVEQNKDKFKRTTFSLPDASDLIFIYYEKTCNEKDCTHYSRCHTFENGTSKCICKLGCERNLDPVCASDGNSYDNLCILQRESCLRKAGLAVKHQGECEKTCNEEDCKDYSRCHTFENGTSKCICHLGCGRNLDPVCASDGNSYDNLCIMQKESCLRKAGLTVKHQGECDSTIEVSGIIYAEKSPSNLSPDSCLIIEVRDTSLQDVASLSLGVKEVPFDSNLKQFPYKYTMTSLKPDKDAVEVTVSATLRVNHCSRSIKSGDYITDTMFTLNLTDPTKSAYNVDVHLVEYIIDKCKEKECRFNSKCEQNKDGEATCVCNPFCPLIYKPVCGSDDEDYANECLLEYTACNKQRNITVKKRGKCNELFTEKTCKEKDCTDYSKCHTFENGTSKCICQLGCGRNLDPVCASDGNSYDNLCIMQKESCLRKAGLTVKYQGECESTIEISGSVNAEGAPSNLSSDSCLRIEARDTSLQDVSSLSLGVKEVPFDSNLKQFPYKYTMTSLKPKNAVEVTISATLHVNHCSRAIKSGDYITDAMFTLNLTDSAKSAYSVDVDLVKYTYDVCDAVICKNYAVCHKKDGKAVCECPEACPLIYKPVCGSDGRSYANECIMKSTSCLDDRVIKVSRKGTCENACKEKCTDYSRCHTFENGTSKCICKLGCGRNLDPVCASDGNSYDNLCIMKRESCVRKAGLTVKHQGECDVCDSVVCKNYAVCRETEGKGVCECPKICPMIYKPVCGSDDRTYANECVMKSTSCLDDRMITVSHKGICNKKCKFELGLLIPHGHLLQFNGVGCPNCRCENGQIKCPAISCPNEQCEDGVLQMDEADCCPTCVIQHKCLASGKSYNVGEKFFVNKTSRSCEVCTCLVGGRSSCKEQKCPVLKCRNPMKINSSCCPVCPTQIRCKSPKTGDLYKLGETWSNGNMNGCSKCTCVGLSPTKGTIECKEPNCPSLNCEKYVYLKGTCCPTCYQKNPKRPLTNISDIFCKAELNPIITRQASCTDPRTSLVYAEGETWKEGCLKYECSALGMFATQQKCPALSCPRKQQIRKPGKCCAECLRESLPALTCSGRGIVLAVPKTFLPYASSSQLKFDGSNCSAKDNGTHFILKTDYQSCGTTRKLVNDVFEYRNLARTVEKPGVLISRLRPIQIPVVCVVPNQGKASFSKAFKPRNEEVASFNTELKSLVETPVKADVVMEVFTAASGHLPEGTAIEVQVGEEVFVDIKKVKKEFDNWVVVTEKCYVTPDSDPVNPTSHSLIANGCPLDPTVKLYPQSGNGQRFSFKSLAFRNSKNAGFFLHCDTILCDASQGRHVCSTSCNNRNRRAIYVTRNRNRNALRSSFTKFISYRRN